MASSRSTGRDVHIFDAKNPENLIGGLALTEGVTNANFYTMVDILCILDEVYYIRNEAHDTVQRNANPLRPGNYYVVSEDAIAINNEPWLFRTLSVEPGSRVSSFRDAVRQRDQRCIITGQQIFARFDDWVALKAAHVFPLAHQSHWNTHNYDRWITIPAPSGGSINSVQNGILMLSHIHILFDNYRISINPDDGCKIICFGENGLGLAGNYLSQTFIDDPRRPVDQLLRWHFRQSVLANMRGAGEPVFENDFPPGSDVVNEIMNGPMPAERMEFELFSRLAASS